MSIEYTELHCITNYSFLRGASHPHEYVAEAKKLGYQSIAITDECTFSGVVKAWTEAKKQGVKLIIGSEFCCTSLEPEKSFRCLFLVKNKRGYQQLSAFISRSRRCSEKGQYRLLMDDFLQDLAVGLDHCVMILLCEKRLLPEQLEAILAVRKKHLWLGVSLLQDGYDDVIYAKANWLSKQYQLPMVACGNVHMHHYERKPLQDLLTAIRLKTNLKQLGRMAFKNAENHLRSLAKIAQIYPSDLIKQTHTINQLCHFDLSQISADYPRELVPKCVSPTAYLRQLCEQGCVIRWPKGIPGHVNALLKKELTIIQQLAYEYFFLTVYDIVAFARRKDILCQGRGSAANSVVCYCLLITEVDPARSELLFERFISKERNEPPDIDVDFEHERREEVIQYIYKKYGRSRAALAATVITYRPKSAIRDVGKALDIDPFLIEKLTSSTAWWDSKKQLIQRFDEARMDGDTSWLAKRFLFLIDQILGFPRHLSQHVGGFIITHSPISHLVPIENAAMPGRSIVQWDKYDIAAMGLLKIDVLALGMLTAIRKSIDLINSYMPLPIQLPDIPAEDPKTYAMLCRGDSIGVFQVESRAQIAMLPRLKPKTFYDLVIQVAIVRPGPIQGDMVHPFLKRREASETFSYPNEAIKKVLARTLGVPIFQEQVIKLAMVAAGFSGGEADQLRRAMADWKKTGELENFREKLISGMLARGQSLAFAEKLFKQMKGFGEYGFPESHAASFALLVYVSAWLKCHYPAAFYCGLLNSQPMGFYTPSQLVQDARKHQIQILPIDIRYSFWESSLEHLERRACLLESQPSIRLGMRQVKGLSKVTAEKIIQARLSSSFKNLQALSSQADLSRAEVERLIAANACQHLTDNRHQGLWQAAAIKKSKPLFESYENRQADLLSDQIQMLAPRVEEDMLADYDTTGLTLGVHPMQFLRNQAPFKRCKLAEQLTHLNPNIYISIAGLVTCRQRPAAASGVLFLTLEDETGNINVILWEGVQTRFRQALVKSQILLVKGKMEKKHSVVHVIAGYVEDVSHHLAGLKKPSRDFH